MAKNNGLEINIRDRLEDNRRVYNNETTVLPSQVHDWLGVFSRNPLLKKGMSCTDGNDSYELDFPTIAAHLRKTYLGEAMSDG